MGKDYYSILGVSKDCTTNDLKKAYRKLAMMWHPDKHKDVKSKKEAEEKFKNIAEAYDVLSDEEKRKIYDAYGEEGLKGSAPTGGNTYVYSGVDPSELFSRIFGSDGHFSFSSGFDDDFSPFSTFVNMTSRKARPSTSTNVNNNYSSKPATFEVPLALTLEELYSGCKKKLKITRKRFMGSKSYEDDNYVTIDVKAGWKDGTKITFYGEGDQLSPMSQPGDLVFKVKTKTHDRFVRDSNNLIYKCPVPLDKALTGFQFIVKSLDNRDINVRVDEIVTPKTKKVVSKEGMPSSKMPNTKGDLIVEFDIIFPKNLTGEKKKIIREALVNTF
ncbi:protein SIS1, putative [Plasmodium vivax]|uniref:Heat shock protein, putative n=6 Tax=Plasmodium vivax TaxID=5855 RepID=A5KBZ1_PLAVS|nr:heat shock protein, putative [Plasmodium vivax]KMZ82266.1 heat shock protein [Plasmodium vivax India VII]KMZ88390.1 heat shock protein [Plasmodium vivax Brazil I]KMZ94755.1 heat shock protein [Plasmodium vivax Mauritania I]KNA01403.1 heat shock protein [Plasmodium vivax North Korean]EDL43187.1 heat shock protein, putative [Plasmodium vivax]|eukprot:XP_001612914.1 heat shock protein [Plasmodium vivax Sal-1]